MTIDFTHLEYMSLKNFRQVGEVAIELLMGKAIIENKRTTVLE
ncbi:MAG: hypothetical protein ACTSP3_03020 [Candidatus Heimdallarchaeaceae archaeon]